jgi:hypothetical protein
VFPFWRVHALRCKSEEPFQKKEKRAAAGKPLVNYQLARRLRLVLARLGGDIAFPKCRY